jgi:uncharacterized membrane protein YdjX (TVP38/TMEM64 family)
MSPPDSSHKYPLGNPPTPLQPHSTPTTHSNIDSVHFAENAKLKTPQKRSKNPQNAKHGKNPDLISSSGGEFSDENISDFDDDDDFDDFDDDEEDIDLENDHYHNNRDGLDDGDYTHLLSSSRKKNTSSNIRDSSSIKNRIKNGFIESSPLTWQDYCRYIFWFVLITTCIVTIFIYRYKLKILIHTIMKHRIGGYFILCISFMLQALVCLPTLPLVLAGGYTYGVTVGSIIITIASLSTACIAFLISRYFFRDYLRTKFNIESVEQDDSDDEYDDEYDIDVDNDSAIINPSNKNNHNNLHTRSRSSQNKHLNPKTPTLNNQSTPLTPRKRSSSKSVITPSSHLPQSKTLPLSSNLGHFNGSAATEFIDYTQSDVDDLQGINFGLLYGERRSEFVEDQISMINGATVSTHTQNTVDGANLTQDQQYNQNQELQTITSSLQPVSLITVRQNPRQPTDGALKDKNQTATLLTKATTRTKTPKKSSKLPTVSTTTQTPPSEATSKDSSPNTPNFWSQIDQVIADDGFTLVFLLRFSPLHPYGMFNYLFGVTSVPFHQYILASLVSLLPTIVMEVYLGSALKNVGEIISLTQDQRSIAAPNDNDSDSLLPQMPKLPGFSDNKDGLVGDRDENTPVGADGIIGGGDTVYDIGKEGNPELVKNHVHNNQLSDVEHNLMKHERQNIVFWCGLIITLLSALFLTLYIKSALKNKLKSLQLKKQQQQLLKKQKKQQQQLQKKQDLLLLRTRPMSTRARKAILTTTGAANGTAISTSASRKRSGSDVVIDVHMYSVEKPKQIHFVHKKKHNRNIGK